VLVIDVLETVELLGGRATGSPLTAAVCATHAPKQNKIENLRKIYLHNYLGLWVGPVQS
jgi:hypothetical protein